MRSNVCRKAAHVSYRSMSPLAAAVSKFRGRVCWWWSGLASCRNECPGDRERNHSAAPVLRNDPERCFLTPHGGANDNGVSAHPTSRTAVFLRSLIAEAKRRARQRRLLLTAVAVAIAAGAAIDGTLGLRSSGQARPAALVAAPACRTT